VQQLLLLLLTLLLPSVERGADGIV
jgi:hypothetical protein